MSSPLEKAKELETNVLGFSKYFDAIVNIARGGVVANAFRAVAVLFLTFGWFMLKRAIRDIRIDMAAQLTEHEKNLLKEYLTGLNADSDDSTIDDYDREF